MLFKLLANIVIYVCAITVGVMSYYMADRKHRKAFLEARQSLEVKLNLEEQSQQQVKHLNLLFMFVFVCMHAYVLLCLTHICLFELLLSAISSLSCPHVYGSWMFTITI